VEVELVSLRSLPQGNEFYLVLLKTKESENPDKAIRNLIINSILAGLLIFGYFTWHFLAAQ